MKKVFSLLAALTAIFLSANLQAQEEAGFSYGYVELTFDTSDTDNTSRGALSDAEGGTLQGFRFSAPILEQGYIKIGFSSDATRS